MLTRDRAGSRAAASRLFASALLLVSLQLGAPIEGMAEGPPAPMEPNRVMGTGEPRVPQRFTREQRLLEAARKGDRAVVERALELGVSVHAKDDMNRSVLLLAARDAHDLELVRFLRERGAAADEADLGGRTALSFAAGEGRLEIVEYLAAQGAQTDRPDKRGRTPLFHAVLANHLGVVRWLLDHGAAVDPRDRFEDTPLIAACAKGQAEMAALLRANGADPHARDQEGRGLSERAAPEVRETEACMPPRSA